MRVLLDQECAAVAGGHESVCEEAITGICAAAGAVVGGIVGTGAGGVGLGPGAVGGFTAGAAIGEVVNGPICRWAESQKKSGGGRAGGNWDEPSSLSGGSPDFYPPWRFQVNTNNF